jgi:hypothetical protein
MRKIKHLNFVTIYKNEDEYIVKTPNEATDYFTGDWPDALQTAERLDTHYQAAQSQPALASLAQ